ncbi:MAG: hypothetical protein S4CHLAM102_14820 [Chlamydiia bacterium]|nr:hypothetical protein [Chlamydiia bacterium]
MYNVGTARRGVESLDKTFSRNPDLVTHTVEYHLAALQAHLNAIQEILDRVAAAQGPYERNVDFEGYADLPGVY